MSNSKDFDDDLMLTKPTLDDDDELELLSSTKPKSEYLAPASSITSEKIKQRLMRLKKCA